MIKFCTLDEHLSLGINFFPDYIMVFEKSYLSKTFLRILVGTGEIKRF